MHMLLLTLDRCKMKTTSPTAKSLPAKLAMYTYCPLCTPCRLDLLSMPNASSTMIPFANAISAPEALKIA